GARRLPRHAARPRDPGARRGRHQPVRVDLHPPLAPRLALAAAAPRAAALDARRDARARIPRAAAPPRLLRNPLRARHGCPLVPCGTRRDRLRTDHGGPDRPRLAGCRCADDGTCLRPVRALSASLGAAAARPVPEHRARRRPNRAPSENTRPKGDGGLMGRAVRMLGATLIVAGSGAVLWGLVVWQWQDPFTAI